ncbi:hypothetical protein [Actinomycetospora sp. CA-084318]|uniref:hypothetical protein n=1 Tax=Actinomycetospora sp. CA-084318 TaxID=3239892 RepID=UPI003D983C72
MAQATSAEDDAADEHPAEPTHPYVEALTGLPGVEHVAVVDVSGRRVLGEWGGPAGSADPLLERARAAADRTGRRELSDVESTTPSAIHLSRLVLANPDHPESVWVAVRIDRAQGNLAWSRAALAGLDHPAGLPRIPVPRAASERPVATPPEVGPAVPAQRVVPPPPVRASGPVPTPVPPPPPAPLAVPPTRAHVTLTARPVPPPPGAPQDGAETTETAVPEVATTVELAAPALPEPPEPVAQPVRATSFAPVMVVAPPPAPVPDDGSFEEPAPMPYPVVFAPDPTADGQPGPQVDAEEVHPEPQAAPVSPVSPVAPEPDPQDADEPRVVRRLIQGLRRRP